MKFITAATLAFALAGCATAQSKEARPATEKPVPDAPMFAPTEVESRGSVTVGGVAIPYRAVAGTLVIHPKGWDDTVPIERKRDKDAAEDVPNSEASMFYTAYFKEGAPAESRPVTFLFNGGPGSPTLWLHMGAYGPVRVETPAAPGWLYAAGELSMTATDLAKWDIARMNRALLPADDWAAQETTTKLNDGKDTNYGLGVSVTRPDGRTMIEHSGEAVGFLSENMVFPEQKTAVSELLPPDDSISSMFWGGVAGGKSGGDT